MKAKSKAGGKSVGESFSPFDLNGAAEFDVNASPEDVACFLVKKSLEILPKLEAQLGGPLCVHVLVRSGGSVDVSVVLDPVQREIRGLTAAEQEAQA